MEKVMTTSDKFATIGLYLIFIIVMVVGVLLFYGCKSSPNIKVSDIYQMQSNIDSRRTVIYGKGAKAKGYLQPSAIDPRKTVQYSKKGNAKGYWKQDPIDPRRLRFYKKN